MPNYQHLNNFAFYSLYFN